MAKMTKAAKKRLAYFYKTEDVARFGEYTVIVPTFNDDPARCYVCEKEFIPRVPFDAAYLDFDDLGIMHKAPVCEKCLEHGQSRVGWELYGFYRDNEKPKYEPPKPELRLEYHTHFSTVNEDSLPF